MTLSAVAVPSIAMSDASHEAPGRRAAGDRPCRIASSYDCLIRARLPVNAADPTGVRRLLVRLHPKRQTDAWADERTRLGYAVGIVDLRRIVHDEKASRLQIHMHGTAWCRLRPD